MKKGQQNLNSDSDVAIKVEGLSKSFRVPHQKIDSVRGAFVNLFAKQTYDDFKALDDISFEVKKGEFVGILGHNGSGKSTLLKCLAQVYTPDSGKITINGEISPFLELGIGFNPELSGRDNVYLNATILGLSPQEIEQKFDEIVEFSEIGEFIDQQVKNYSSGMRGRLAFSVSVHANRDILLMDEVLAVGDERFKQKCMDHFAQYKKMGKTVILVTHSMGAVREHCDRGILLNRGKIIASDTGENIAEKYIENNLSEDQRQLMKKKLAREKSEKKLLNKVRREKEILHRKRIEQKQRVAQEKIIANQRAIQAKREHEQKKLKEKELSRLYYIDDQGRKFDLRESVVLRSVNIIEENESEATDAAKCKIQIKYKIEKFDQAQWSAGVSVYTTDEDPVYIAGVNTFSFDDDIGSNEELNFCFDKSILRPGKYRFDVGIFCKIKKKYYFPVTESLYATVERDSVKDRDKRGLIALDSTWNYMK